MALAIILTGCQNNKNGQAHEDRFDNNPNLRDDIDMYNDKKDVPNCFDICHNKIQDICMDDIVELEASDAWYGDSILDTDHCDSLCNSLSDDVLVCMSKATKCESISSYEPYCREEEDNSAVEYEPEQETNYNCSKACYKYKECAMKADDARPEDGESAYQTCFEECQNWSKETVSCVNNTETGTNMGCANMTACALREYNKYLK